MLYLRICVIGFLLGSTKGSFVEAVGRSLYRPSLENKTLFGTDCITLEKKLDIAFVLDISKNVEFSDFVQLRNFVLYTTKVLELGADKTRVSVILSSASSTTIVTFHEGIDHKLFSDYLRNRMIYISSPFSFLTSPAMSYLSERVFVEANGARNNSRKAVIWITSSNNAILLKFTKYSDLERGGVRFFVVAITNEAKMSEDMLKEIVDDDSDYIYLDSYNLLATCEVLNDALINAYDCDPCLPNPCMESTCVTVNSTYICQCSPGKRGRLCELQDYCYPNPCNGGVCINPIGSTIICTCPVGRTGVICETIQAACPSNYCKHGGTCTSYANGTLSCSCSNFFAGAQCQYVNLCLVTNPCKNGGLCVPGSTYPYVCHCVQPYSGKKCEKDPCTSMNPCYNGGSCIYNHVGNYYWCTCSTGYTGQHCEHFIPTSTSNTAVSTMPTTLNIPKNPPTTCASSPCSNGGTCIDVQPGQYYCYCKSNCGGTVCETCVIPTRLDSPVIDISCISNPCKSDCQCIESRTHELGYYCQDPSGLLGKDCNIGKPLLECLPSAVHIMLSEDILQQFQQKNLHEISEGIVVVGPQYDPLDSCVVNRRSGTNYEITVALSSCGMSRMITTNGITRVSNTVWIYHRKGDSFTLPIPLFRFRCAYSDSEYRLVSALKPMLPITTPIIKGEVSIKPVIILCKVPACQAESCPQELTVTTGAVYTVGEFIHLSLALEFQISQRSDIVTSVKKLTISCSAIHDPSASINVMENGCPLLNSNLPVVIQQNSIGKWVCLSFAVPRMKQCNSVYIHATLQSCSYRLRQICGDGKNFACPVSTRGRRKRNSEHVEKFVVIGPLLIINGSHGVPVVQLYPKDEPLNILLADDPASAFPAVSTIMLVLLFLVVFFIILKSLFSYCRQ